MNANRPSAASGRNQRKQAVASITSQSQLSVSYKGHVRSQTFRVDLICHDHILVEVKAVKSLSGEHLAQVINYLRGCGLRLGLLVNFGSFPQVTVERIAFSKA